MSGALREVALDDPAWGWRDGDVRSTEFDGRPCTAFGDEVNLLGLPAGVSMVDGTIEIDVAVTGERAFHGLVWRVLDRANYESFYVRPHQVGNPDSIQYNPVYNDVASWQLYHGDGYWAPILFPIGSWFTIRVVFAGDRLEVFVGDTAVPALESRLLMPAVPGGAGILIGGPGLYVSRFAWSDAPPAFVGSGPAPIKRVPGIIPGWLISDAFAEPDPPPLALPGSTPKGRDWTLVDSEPTGIVNLAQVNGVADGADTCWAVVTVVSESVRTIPMHLGFSDRVVLYLNGRALFRGDDSYRSRDYRFLGSIGWYDTVFLPLDAGGNDLAIAVSESFGGWGVQARFDDLDGIRFSPDRS
ncbi:MAG TPA: hypothetical protein VJ850_01480 [Candidatus Limnocylindrales bacterium]|nr:hypothetical protein [Candidatus Limnocylindrales bacterium]